MDINSLIRHRMLANIDAKLARSEALRAPRRAPGPRQIPRGIRLAGQAFGIRRAGFAAGLGTQFGLTRRLARWGWTAAEYRATVLGLPEWAIASGSTFTLFARDEADHGPLAVRGKLRRWIGHLINEVLEETPETPVETVAGWLTVLASATEPAALRAVYGDRATMLAAWRPMANLRLPGPIVALGYAAGCSPVETYAWWHEGSLDEAGLRVLTVMRGFRLPDSVGPAVAGC